MSAANSLPVIPLYIGLVAVEIVACTTELLAEEIGRRVRLVEREGCAILREAMQSAGFPGQGFNEHADRHAGGEGVRVDDHVGLDAGFAEWHVLAWPEEGAHALLTVAAGEFNHR